MPSSLGGASQTLSQNRQASKNSRMRDHLSQVNYANNQYNNIASKSVSGYNGGNGNKFLGNPKSPMMNSNKASKAHLNMIRSQG